MKLDMMKELLALQNYGSFSQTAEKLFLTQPSLSRHIAAMEKELGVSLLRRDTHRLEFTEEGLEACRTFQKILNLYDGLCTDFERKKAGIKGTLRLGTLYYTVHEDLKDVTMRFWKEYPNARLVTYSWQPKDVYAALMEQRIDLGILPRTRYGAEKGLLFQDFEITGGVAMLPADHPLAQKDSVTLEELSQETLLLLDDDLYLSASILEGLEDAGFHPKDTSMTPHTDTVPYAIIDHKGIYIVGPYNYYGLDKDIRIVKISDEKLRFHKAFAWHRENENPLIQRFLNMV
ncbi:MAG: LysR family transcriptional regulator [Clostridiales bacterium]|nr:LysR family transcriptional regulator [Clostridiales bacterium]